MTRSRQEVDKMDFRWKNRGQFNQSGHEDENYSNLDWTLPESEFLKDVDEELIKNTYIEYNNHWMKKFIKFTDAEFESFNIKRPSNDSEQRTSEETTGFARIPEDDADEISQSLQYLDEWKRNLKTKKLEDDYQVKLPNGMVVPYREYLDSLGEDGKKSDNKQVQHKEIELRRMKENAEWYKREPVHDEYGRSHGDGWRKAARAKAMVYE